MTDRLPLPSTNQVHTTVQLIFFTVMSAPISHVPNRVGVASLVGFTLPVFNTVGISGGIVSTTNTVLVTIFPVFHPAS